MSNNLAPAPGAITHRTQSPAPVFYCSTTTVNNCGKIYADDAECFASFSLFKSGPKRYIKSTPEMPFARSLFTPSHLPFNTIFFMRKLLLKPGFFAIALLMASLFFVNGVFGQATVTTDKPDYAPLSNAVFTGRGFAPNEEIVLKVKNLTQPCNTVSADSSYLPWTVTADASGNFVTDWTVCNCPGDSLRLKATGQASGLIAYAFFTDSPDAWKLTTSPSTVCIGVPTTFTIRVTGVGNGNSSIACANINIPASFGSLGTPILGTVSNSTTSWSVSRTGSVVQVKTTANGDRLTNAQYVEFTITATATTITGSPFSWSGGATQNTNCSGQVTNLAPSPTTIVNTLPSNTSNGFSGNTICTGGTGTLTFDALDATFVSPYTITYKETAGVTTWNQTISSASATTFNVAVNPTTTTTYTLVSITNGNGCTTTTGFGDATAQITVNTAPAITSQPVNQTVTYGSPSTSFAVAANGTGPLSYQWQVNTGSGFTNISTISGIYANTDANPATLEIAQPTVAMSGYTYRAVVSGTCSPVATSNEVILTVNARPITITADAKNKIYGEIDPALTYQITSGSLAFSDVFAGALSRVAGENVGTYAINQGTVDNTNYTITYTSANLAITPLAVTVTAGAKSKVYGDVDPALTFVSSPAVGSTLANSEVISFTGSLSRVAGENVGTYAINQGTVGNTNYTITYTSANLSITPLAVTVTAEAKSKIYGDVDPALTYTSSPAVGSTLANSEVISFAGSLSRVAGENVGSYAINQGTVDNTNYTITYTSANLGITPLAVTVTAGAKSKVYGDVDPALTYTSSPAVGSTLANSEVISFAGSLSRVAGENVGTYAINQGTVDNTNYTITYTSANLSITPLAVMVTAEAKSKIYGDVDPALTYTSSPAVGSTLANSEVISFTGSLSRVAGENVGTYAINQGTVDNTNYTITYTSANLSITPLAVTVTADAKSKVYGDVDPALTYTSSPAVGSTLANSEVISFTGSLSRVAGENVGTYAINQGTVDNTNYTITYTSANLSITPLAVTVTADAKSKVYGDVDPALTYTSNPAVGSTLANSEVISFAGSLSRVAGENVGTYAISQGSVNNTNYTISYTSADLTITPLSVTVTADAKSKVYGDVDPALTYTSNPAVGSTLANSEVISFAGSLSRVAGENVGAMRSTRAQ